MRSLAWKDLIEDPQQIAAQVAALEPVVTATPRLLATGLVSSGKKNIGLSIIGVDPASEANAPYRSGMVSGTFPEADDRQGILIGLPLAEKLKMQVGDSMLLLVNTSEGEIDEQSFIVRGIYTTGTSALDKNTVLMPLAKAQTITRTENHASIIFTLLKDREQAAAVAEALKNASYQVVTWQEMFALLVGMESYVSMISIFIYILMFGMTSVVIVNTLIMSVRERTREIGILSALGMKSRQIMGKFFAESGLIAIAGTIVGLIIGVFLVTVVFKDGYYFGDVSAMGLDPATLVMSDTVPLILKTGDVITIALVSLVVTLLAGFFPARIAARMEPIVALRGGTK